MANQKNELTVGKNEIVLEPKKNNESSHLVNQELLIIF